MHINKAFTPILLFVLLVINSCHPSDKPVVVSSDSAGNITAIYLSPDKTNDYGIKFISLFDDISQRTVACSGHIVFEHENRFVVASPADGKVVLLHKHNGQSVGPDTEIAGLENTDFIILQQEYLEAINQFAFFKDEYARQGDLTVENATSMKKMQIARRDYQSAELKYHSLSLQLKILGINPDSIKPDKLIQVLPVLSPRAGIISNMNIHTGTFVKQGDPLFELISKRNIFVKLLVPEEAYMFIHPGQSVQCNMYFDSLDVFKATVRTIIPKIDTENQMATIYAELVDDPGLIVPGMSVMARIRTGQDSTCIINSGSVLSDGTGDYIFAFKKGTCYKIPVKPGRISEGQTEIQGLSIEMSDSVVINGPEKLAALFKHQ